MRKSLLVLISASFAISSLTACNNNANLQQVQPLQQVQQNVQAQSFKSIYDDLKKVKLESFKGMDTDNDAKLTPKEYQLESPEDYESFRALDSNKDGYVTLKEWTPGTFNRISETLSIQKTARNLFKRIDTSGDKYISQAEYASYPLLKSHTDLFAKFNVEKPGKIFNKGTADKLSKKEFENLFANISMTAGR